MRIKYIQFCLQNDIPIEKCDDCLSQKNKNLKQFLQFLKDNKQQELIDRYDIVNNKQFEVQQIVQIMNKYQLDQNEMEILNNQIIEKYCFKNVVFRQSYDITPEFQDNGDKITIAMWFTQHNSLVPRQWMHNYGIENKDGKTLKDLMIENDMPIPQHWQDEGEMTIFDKAYFGIVPEIGQHASNEQDENGWTVAMLLAMNNIEIPKEWEHRGDLQNHTKYTVAIILSSKGIIPPQQWYHSPELQDQQYKNTVAINLAKNKILPPRKWMHGYIINNRDEKSLKDYLQDASLPVPQHWSNKNMNIFDQAIFGMTPDIQGHKSDETNYNCFTVAMLQAQIGKIPDKQWQHDKFLRCKYQDKFHIIHFYTVQNILQEQNIDVPDEWKYTILNRNEDNQAMIDARNGIIPQLGNNNPLQTNINGDTVAMILAQKGIMPSKEWMHSLNIKNKYDKSLKNYLIDNNLPIPQHWKDNKMNIFDQACFKIVPNVQGHKSNEQDLYGFTVAMILALNGVDIPQEWYHDPELKNIYGQTVAMIYAKNGIVPPEQWYHNQLFIDYHKQTVAMMLSEQSIIPPQCWYYDSPQDSEYNYSVIINLIKNQILPPIEWQRVIDKNKLTLSQQQFLLDNNYIKIDKYLIPPDLIQTEIIDDVCQICYSNKEQKFIKTNCDDKICYNCFQKMNKNADQCPICRQKKWFQYYQQIILNSCYSGCVDRIDENYKYKMWD